MTGLGGVLGGRRGAAFRCDSATVRTGELARCTVEKQEGGVNPALQEREIWVSKM
jgi:hypothetical protein